MQTEITNEKENFFSEYIDESQEEVNQLVNDHFRATRTDEHYSMTPFNTTFSHEEDVHSIISADMFYQNERAFLTMEEPEREVELTSLQANKGSNSMICPPRTLDQTLNTQTPVTQEVNYSTQMLDGVLAFEQPAQLKKAKNCTFAGTITNSIRSFLNILTNSRVSGSDEMVTGSWTQLRENLFHYIVQEIEEKEATALAKASSKRVDNLLTVVVRLLESLPGAILERSVMTPTRGNTFEAVCENYIKAFAQFALIFEMQTENDNTLLENFLNFAVLRCPPKKFSQLLHKIEKENVLEESFLAQLKNTFQNRKTTSIKFLKKLVKENQVLNTIVERTKVVLESQRNVSELSINCLEKVTS